jgi:hypothetical protein
MQTHYLKCIAREFAKCMRTAPFTTAFIIGLITAVEFTITYVAQQHLAFLTPIIWGVLGGSTPIITLALVAHDCKRHGEAPCPPQVRG